MTDTRESTDMRESVQRRSALKLHGSTLLIVGFASLFMLPGFGITGAFTGDAQTHWNWQRHFAHQFWSGELTPRWLAGGNDGFGSPAFFIYPPLVHWLASLSQPLLPADTEIPLRFSLALLLLLIVSGIGARAWVRELTGNAQAATLGALLYVLLPYHAYVNTFQRGAYAELAAMAWVPWLFTGARRVATEGKANFLFPSALFLVLISHAPSALFVTSALAVYLSFILLRQRSSMLVAIYILSGSAAMLSAGFYLGPALLESAKIDHNTLFADYFHPTKWLLFQYPWPDGGMQLVIAVNAGLYVLFALLALFVVFRTHRDMLLRRSATQAFLAFAAIIVLMSPVAQPFWGLKTPFTKIQFPWRLLTLATFFLATLAALAVYALRENWLGERRGNSNRWLFGIPIFLLLLNHAMLVARLYKAGMENRAPPSIEQTLRNTRGEFDFRLGDLDKAQSFFTPTVHQSTWAPGPRGVSHGARTIVIETNFDRPTVLALHQFNYLGWQIKIDGKAAGSSYPLRADLPVMAVRVPAGHHTVQTTFALTSSERVGLLLSTCGVSLFLMLFLLRRRLVLPGRVGADDALGYDDVASLARA